MSGWTIVRDGIVTLEHMSTSSQVVMTLHEADDMPRQYWFDYAEFDSLCRCIEQLLPVLNGPEVEKVPDLSGLDKTNKDDLINGVVEITAKNVLSTFVALGLQTHIDASVVNDANGDKFRLQFTKID